METRRGSGILMHVSSLPGRYGIGEAGEAARNWIDFLARCGVTHWQMLPLNPTGYGNSPYQGLSAFAGNPLFIDPLDLVELGLLQPEALDAAPAFAVHKVNFKKVRTWKSQIFHEAFTRFSRHAKHSLASEFEEFLSCNAFWMHDFALFMAIRDRFQQTSWKNWPPALKMRDPDALQDFELSYPDEIRLHAFLQFMFARQWQRVRSHARERGVKLIGDIPIFMGYDSVDVWAHPHLYQLNRQREPSAVAGVPPDFFSPTGQLWGNPLYDWRMHKKEGYTWWLRRIKATLNNVDLIRLDHFRGFAGYYRISTGETTARNGQWVAGPGSSFFNAVQKEIGRLPFIAEDLGVITPDVVELRELFHLSGMRVFQFAFSEEADNPFLPHNYPQNCVAYTGTHDNDTLTEWYRNAPQHTRRFVSAYLGYHTRNIAHEIIRTVWGSATELAIAPMQDFLRLGRGARMNQPATIEGNWQWRMRPDAIREELEDWIREINITFLRAPEEKSWSAYKYFQAQ